MRKAKAAGADFVGADDLIQKIQGENCADFDVALATPGHDGRWSGALGKVLGPRPMPTPKAGTGPQGDVAAAIKEFKAGKVEYRSDAAGDRPRRRRQAELRRADAARELRRARGRADARAAGGGEGPLPADDHPHHHDGPGREGRPGAHPRNRRGARAGSLGPEAFCPRPPAAARRKSGAGGAARTTAIRSVSPPACGLFMRGAVTRTE